MSIISTIRAQDVSETIYKGKINADGKLIDFVIKTHIEDNTINSELYLPGSFIYAKKIKETIITEDSLKCLFPSMKAELKASFDKDIIIAKWYQAGQVYSVEMDIASADDVSFLERPQTPQEPFTYEIKDICIENKKGEATLCGTLTIPDFANDHPLVILITGSGAQDRNEDIGGHKPFWVIADFLTNCGFAVFRYDDRGFGESKGDMRNATTYDFMTDAAAVLHYFEDYPNIEKGSIGVIGHSEGGMIAWMLAAKYPKDVAFVISLAGPGVDVMDLMLKQTIDISISSGIDEDTVKMIGEMQKEVYKVTVNSKNSGELRTALKEIYDRYGKDMTEEERAAYNLTDQGLNMAVIQLSSPWLKYFLQFEPSKYLKKIKCPVLAINGNKDVQVNAEQNLEGIKSSINPKKCKVLEIHELEGLNHLFQTAEEGTVEEYYYLNETFSMDVLRIIEDFLYRNL